MLRKAAWPTVFALCALAGAAATAAPAAQQPAALPTINDANLKPQFTHVGGADPQATDRTVPHWFGSFVDPQNHQTYGYNMVGVDPATNGSSTVPVDIVPLSFSFASAGGASLDGGNIVPATLASPIFQTNNYSTTSLSTGGAGALSVGNVGQYADAVMRSQFNKVGSAYHLRLGSPTVLPVVTIQVPQNQGVLALNSRGVLVGLVSNSWFSAQVNNLMNGLNLDPTHLAMFLTNNTMLYLGKPDECCVVGFHGAANSTGNGLGKVHSSSGSTALQTFVFSAYTTPGTFNPANGYFVKDVYTLSHEVVEWATDPFLNNTVEPWFAPTAPQYGCSNLFETGDPVFGIGFNVGTNGFDTNAFADGSFHASDEAFLPWFARQSPNTLSEPLQGGTTGRYTFMGTLNTSPVFHAPATGC